MSTIPWGDRGDKATPILADKSMLLDSEEIDPTLENKLYTFDSIKTLFQPTRLISVSSQAELEEKLGTNIEIPNGVAMTVVLDDSFTLTKPFKIGSASGLEVYSGVTRTTLTYTGSGALFQNTNPANDILSLSVHDIFITGDGTNRVLDIVGLTGVSFFLARSFQFTGFASFGLIDVTIVDIRMAILVSFGFGLVIRNPTTTVLNSILLLGAPPANGTFFSFISNGPISVNINSVVSLLAAGDTLFFLDPNSTVGTSYIVTDSNTATGDFYQQGVDIAATAAAASGSDTQFDITAHNLVVGQAVVLKDFSTFTGYNGTFLVTAVNDANSVDIGVGFLGIDITGTMTEQSLDATSVPVASSNNRGEPDSMFTADAGLELFGVEITSSSLAQNAFEVITSASWAFTNLERFSIGVNNEGQVVANDTTLRRYTVSYSATLEKSGGGSLDVGIVILKNGSNVSFNAPHTVNSGKIQISGSDIVELTLSDTLQIAVINYDASAAAIIISQVSMVVNLA